MQQLVLTWRMRNHFHPYLSLSLVLFSLLLFWQFSQDQFLRGPDAYYYALQADYWATTGSVKIPDNSVVHRIIGVLIRTGVGAEAAVRIWICLSLLILGLLSSLMLRRGRHLISASLAGWLLLSPSLLFIAIEFPSLFCMLIVWPVVVYCLAQPRQYTLFAILPALLAVFMHKAAIPLSGLICVLVLLENRKQLFLRRKLLFMLLGIAVGIAGLYFLKSDHFHWLDLHRLGDWQNPSPGVVTLLGREAVPQAIKVELLGSMLLLFIVIVAYWKQNPQQRWPVYYAIALVVPAWIPFSSDEALGVGERYALFLPFLSMLSVLMLVSKQTSRQVADARPRPASFVPVLCVIFLFVSFWRLAYSHPEFLDPENGVYANVTRQIAQEQIPMLIAHRGLNFYYKFKTRKESFPYEPESHWNKAHIWRLAYEVSADEFTYRLPEACQWKSGLIKSTSEKGYFLIREDCWVEFRSRVREDEDQFLYERVWHYWRNPSQSRPDFLYRKHENDSADKKDEFSSFR